MELTAEEERALRALLRRQRQWRWSRFVGLLAGCGILVTCVWETRDLTLQLLSTTRNMSWTQSLTGAEVFFASQEAALLIVCMLVLPALGGLLIGVVLAKWRGDPVDKLLIGMVSRATSKCASHDAHL